MRDPDLRRQNILSYIDARDLKQMVQTHLETDGIGYPVFNVSNDNSSGSLSSAELIKRYYSDIPCDLITFRKAFVQTKKPNAFLRFHIITHLAQ